MPENVLKLPSTKVSSSTVVANTSHFGDAFAVCACMCVCVMQMNETTFLHPELYLKQSTLFGDGSGDGDGDGKRRP